VEEDATADFGIGYSLSGLMGQVLNDAGQGVAGVAIAIRSGAHQWSAATDADGSFFVPSLVAAIMTCMRMKIPCPRVIPPRL
jgi:hypothetical protein